MDQPYEKRVVEQKKILKSSIQQNENILKKTK